MVGKMSTWDSSQSLYHGKVPEPQSITLNTQTHVPLLPSLSRLSCHLRAANRENIHNSPAGEANLWLPLSFYQTSGPERRQRAPWAELLSCAPSEHLSLSLSAPLRKSIHTQKAEPPKYRREYKLEFQHYMSVVCKAQSKKGISPEGR